MMNVQCRVPGGGYENLVYRAVGQRFDAGGMAREHSLGACSQIDPTHIPKKPPLALA